MVRLAETLLIKALKINGSSGSTIFFGYHYHTGTPFCRFVERYSGEDASFNVTFDSFFHLFGPVFCNGSRPICWLWDSIVGFEVNPGWRGG